MRSAATRNDFQQDNVLAANEEIQYQTIKK